jgi:hypothetical protein
MAWATSMKSYRLDPMSFSRRLSTAQCGVAYRGDGVIPVLRKSASANAQSLRRLSTTPPWPETRVRTGTKAVGSQRADREELGVGDMPCKVDEVDVATRNEAKLVESTTVTFAHVQRA